MRTSFLVVGGAGYIGSHMVKMLAASGYDVTVFDNLSRGNRDALLTDKFIQGDLLNRKDLERLFDERHFDLVMHFSALCYVGESVERPLLYYRNNVEGTLNLLDIMKEHGVSRFVFSSTCATYGMPSEIPITEGHQQRPINPYGWTKLFVERMLSDASDAYGLRSIALRYFNAAGCDPEGQLGERHEPETHLIPLALKEALRVQAGGDPKETDLQVYGDDFDTPDGTCIRDYIHVHDLCRAHMAAAGRLMNSNAGAMEAFNLGNGKGFSVKEVIETCRTVTGIPIEYRIVSRRPGDPPQLVGSNKKAEAVLGWSPKIEKLETIIETAWSWLRNR